jgi:hypothetical protein
MSWRSSVRSEFAIEELIESRIVGDIRVLELFAIDYTTS